MKLNWNDYRYFLAVARSGKLSVAGRQLGVDHATVSRRIKALEDATKLVLFDRDPSGYSLTNSGRELLPLAEEVEKGALLAEDSFRSKEEKISGKIRIGVPEGLGSYQIVTDVQKLCELYPYLEVQLVALPQKFSLSKREADFVISVSRPSKGRIKAQKISDYKIHLYAHKSYLKSMPKIKSIEDLGRCRGIGYIPDLIFDAELDLIPLVDRSFNAHLTSTSIHVQKEAVLMGAGICFLPDFMAAEHKELERILPEEISFTRTFWYMVHEDYANLERIRVASKVIIDGLRARLQDYR